MHVFTAVTISLTVASVSAVALIERQSTIWQSPFSGEIVEPTAGSIVMPDVAFAFQYNVSNWCESAFSPFTVYLTEGATPPPFDNVTADGTLADGSYVSNFGQFIVSNFGLPLSTVGGTPPPSSLNLPSGIEKQLDGTSQIYLTVLQQYDGCPGHIAVEYSLTSVPVTLGTAGQ